MSALAHLGIDVVYIPRGLTSQYQPLDVGINDHFKHWLRERWAEQDPLIDQGPIPRKIGTAQLIKHGWDHIGGETVINSFKNLMRLVRNDNDVTDELASLLVDIHTSVS